jgi:hypothetical protein
MMIKDDGLVLDDNVTEIVETVADVPYSTPRRRG